MHSHIIKSNHHLNQDIKAFYHTDYFGYQKPGNPDYVNILKNTYASYSSSKLDRAAQNVEEVLLKDLPQILHHSSVDQLTICVVPRAKAETDYQPSQLLFKTTVQKVANQLKDFIDGTHYIIRHTNTKTTHLPSNTPNYNNDGADPYPGITVDTRDISDDVDGKNILLIDDIYTKNVNINEDAIQSLLDKGANSVIFYSVGRTV